MNLLITGATGFIGTAVTRAARAQGHSVAGLVRPETHATRALRDSNDLIWLQGSLERPPWNRIKAFNPEVCIHAAWIATPGIYLDAPENAEYLRWSIEFATYLQRIGLRRFVGLGTCIEYQIEPDRCLPLNEDCSPVVPASFYAQCKDALRSALQRHAESHRLFSVAWGRIFYPFGPNESPDRLCSRLIRTIIRKQTIMLKTPDSVKDYIYIDDLSAAILLLAADDIEKPVNLGTGTGITVRELARLACAAVDAIPRFEEPLHKVRDPLNYVVADARRLKEMGWTQQFTLEDGLRALARTHLNAGV